MNIMPTLSDAAARGAALLNALRGTTAAGASAPPEPDAARDAVSFSPVAAAIAASGLDPGRSWVEQTASRLEFNLEFVTGQVQQLSARGYYAAESSELSLSLNFTLQRMVTVNGRQEARAFEVQMSLRASHVRSTTAQAFEEKEDIVSLVRRVVDDMFKVARSDNQRLAAVIFDHEDLAELTALNGGRTVMALAHLILQIVQYSNQMKWLQEGAQGDGVQDVILTPQRRITQGVKIEYDETRVNDFTVEIREIASSEESDAPAGP